MMVMDQKNGLYEVAVLKKVTENKYKLCYDTPITDDVIGWLNNEEVVKLLEKIKELENMSEEEIKKRLFEINELIKEISEYVELELQESMMFVDLKCHKQYKLRAYTQRREIL